VKRTREGLVKEVLGGVHAVHTGARRQTLANMREEN